MPIDPIKPHSDPRVTHEFATVNGRKYHYVNAPSTIPEKATALLVHGFPDLWFGWRYIIPHLTSLGLRCIVPDCLGYGQSASPHCPPNDLRLYGYKSMSQDMVNLLDHIGIKEKVVIISHDWGAFFATRIYYHHPERIRSIASICVPFQPPVHTDIKLEGVVKAAPTFKYQLSLADPKIAEARLKTVEDIRWFLNAMWYVREKRKDGYANEDRDKEREEHYNRITSDPNRNFLDRLGNPPKSGLWDDGDLEYYVEEYSRNGMNGPLNWYRLKGGIIYQEEKDLNVKTIPIPTLYIAAEFDKALPPSMAKGQEKFATNLTTGSVKTSHWAMVEDPEAVNRILESWIRGAVLGEDGEEKNENGRNNAERKDGTVKSAL